MITLSEDKNNRKMFIDKNRNDQTQSFEKTSVIRFCGSIFIQLYSKLKLLCFYAKLADRK